MSRVTEGRMEEAQQGRSSARSDEPQARSEVCWSARRKEGIVLRLLRGESLDHTSLGCSASSSGAA